MHEYMLLIRNKAGHQAVWPPEKLDQFLKKREVYISTLTKAGKLKSAGVWKEGPFNESQEVIVGYYHILAEDINDVIAIAKGNPEFEFGTTARIEIRPIQLKEESTGFVSPAAKTA
jgi:hypothetical protein